MALVPMPTENKLVKNSGRHGGDKMEVVRTMVVGEGGKVIQRCGVAGKKIYQENIRMKRK
jgi:hypothetical protein